MENEQAISAKVEHARRVETVLRRLGYMVAAIGITGIAVFAAYWAAGDLSAEQGTALILGTALGTVLSGATTYGAGVNLGLGAERLQLAARTTDPALSTRDRPPDHSARPRK
jgi:hypothetical protein